MKKLLMTMVIGTLSLSSMASESIGEISKNTIVQKGISQEIKTVSQMESMDILLTYLDKKCEQSSKRLVKKGAEKGVVGALQSDCEDKADLISELDIETAKDAYISELQEMQTADNLTFYFTQKALDDDYVSRYYYTRSDGAKMVMTVNHGSIFLPVLVVADIVTLPFTFIASLLTGF